MRPSRHSELVRRSLRSAATLKESKSMPESETDLARRLLSDVLDGTNKWTPDMRLRIATVSQAYASLAIVDELRRANDQRDVFNASLLEFFERLTEEPSPGPSPSKSFGYYAEDPDEMCTARSHPDRRAWRRCLRVAGHDGLHEDGKGNAFSGDHPGPSGDGATAEGGHGE
jgi:hypothetical protein